jgi:uncharacterized protein YbjT (DUF2867 family)
MKVAIAGGHGKIAMFLHGMLRKRGDEPLALIRKQEQEEDIREAGAEPVICDLETADPGEVAAAIEGADAVVFAAGAGPGSGPERKLTVDYGGAVKLIEACTQNGIDRYLMISSYGADSYAGGEDTFQVYLRAKGKADEALERSGLEHTIVRPVRLTDEPGTGKVGLGKVERGEIPREDVAAILAAALHEPATVGKTFEARSGDTPIDEALRSL